MALEYTPEQIAIINRPNEAKVWLTGPSGAGKTTTGVARLLRWLNQGVDAESVLVLVAQRALGLPYLQAVRTHQLAGGMVDVVTMGGIAKRMVELFWPLVSQDAGFGQPGRPPIFLTLETAQYHMARIVRPLIEQERYFDSVTLERNRIYSQVLDNLNKAAVVGFPHTEVAHRLKTAWIGDEGQHNVYDDVQDCANRFRDYCYENNLLDFSLQIEIFKKHIWTTPECRAHLLKRYRYLIADNIEEFTPVSHDLLLEWIPDCDGCLLIQDDEAGYRRFLGADPLTAEPLRHVCDVQEVFPASLVTSGDVQTLEKRLCDILEKPSEMDGYGDPRGALQFEYQRFHPQMIDWVAGEVAQLVHEEGVAPKDIVILAPFLSDALRFSLMNRLEVADVPVQSHRPSRAMLEEPATQCLLTWASLAHPDWGFPPTTIDVANALQQSIGDIDLIRAQLLAETLYRVDDDGPQLLSFDQLRHEMQQRVTYLLGARYEGLRIWLNDYRSRKPEPLDHCIRRIFGEVLSQVGYGFHQNFDAARVAANLIESIEKFRWVAEAQPRDDGIPLGQEYFQLVRDGVIAAQYLGSWNVQETDAVLLAPAYTFLLSNRPVEYQFWLNVSSTGWWERIFQPLTHPHVLSRHWDAEQTWTDSDEMAANQDSLHRLVVGLLRRCRQKIYLGLSELDEQGLDQRGPLLSAVQQVLRDMAGEEDVDGV